jgi:hypothetical protein
MVGLGAWVGVGGQVQEHLVLEVHLADVEIFAQALKPIHLHFEGVGKGNLDGAAADDLRL